MGTIVLGYWNNKKDRIRQLYPELSFEDLSFKSGKEKEMIEILGYKLGKTSEELRTIINRL